MKLLAAFVPMLLSQPVHAAENLIAGLSGRCTAVMALDKPIAADTCKDKLVNMEFANARMGFMFTLTANPTQVTGVAFFGDGTTQTHSKPDEALQPIDSVHYSIGEQDKHLSAMGWCTFTNPFKGIPSHVNCYAETSQGRFAGNFESDGKPPEMFQGRE